MNIRKTVLLSFLAAASVLAQLPLLWAASGDPISLGVPGPETQIKGVVQDVNAYLRILTIKDDNGKTIRFSIPVDASVVKDNDIVSSLSEIKNGDNAVIWYTGELENPTVQRVRVAPKGVQP